MKQLGKVLVLSGVLLAGSSIVPFAAPLAIQGEAAAAVYVSKTAYQTTANLNMRSGAGTKYKVLLTIPKWKQVTAAERSGDWYKVTYSYLNKGKTISKTGWVTGSYLKKVNAGATKVSNKPPVSDQTDSKQKTVINKAKTINKTYQTTANLNIRSGAGTNYSMVKTIPKGGIVYSSDQNGGWYKVTYTYTLSGKKMTVNGWVSGSYLKEYYQYSNTQGTFYFTKKTSNLYTSPDTKNKAVFNVAINNGFYSTQKVVNSVGETWYRVVYNGRNVYIQSQDLVWSFAKSFSQVDFITNKDTYLNASYGSAYTKLLKIPKNTRLTSNYSIGNWYKISFNGKSGYVSVGDLVKYVPPAVEPVPAPEQPSPVPAQPTPTTEQPAQPDLVQTQEPELTETAISRKTFATISNLNLRKTAGTDSEILTIIPNATFVFPTYKVSNGWFKISFNGKTGYVSGDYIKEVITGDPMHRNGYQFIDLRKPSKVTALQIDQYINGYLNSGRTSVLAEKGQAFINAGNKYGVNALYLAAHAILESGYGTSNISLGKFNLFGFGAFDATPFIGAVRFASVEQNIEYIAQEMNATYLNPLNWKYRGAYLGFSTRSVSGNSRIDANSEGMNFYYASDVKWGQKIAAHMQNILPYNKAEYEMAPVDTTSFPYPTRPAGFDAFPVEIQAVAKQDIRLTSQKGSTALAVTLKKDAVFTISEKHNDYWVKLKVDNKDYWTSDIKFDRYKEFISVRNLARVTATSLNVRPSASTAQAPIAALKLNDYVHLALDQTGNPIIDGSKSWYNVKLADGRVGWVNVQFIVQELK